MNKSKKIFGFTLIELTVVITIIGILLLFSFPLFRNLGLFPDAAGQVGDVVRLINDLKKRAVENNVDFILHMDSGSGSLWVTDTAMEDEAEEAAKQKATQLSDKITFLDIEFPGIRETGVREYRIRFNASGYSDFALIHIIEEGENITLKIEPFLSRVQRIEEHVYFEDCI